MSDVAPHAPIRHWGVAGPPGGFARLGPEGLDDPTALLGWLTRLRADGVVFAEGLEPTVEALERFAARLGVVQATNYGPGIWHIVTSDEPPTPVDGDIALRVHTDLPYRRRPPGVQILMAVEADAEGGDTLLVDGHAVTHRLARDAPDVYLELTTRPRAFAHIRTDQRYIGGGPVIGLGDDGRPGIIRHAPDLVLAPRGDDPARAERAYARFTEAVADPSVVTRHRLRPGEAVVFDNHRVLHGRTRVDLATGGRHLIGCYLDHDDLDSTRRVLRRRVS